MGAINWIPRWFNPAGPATSNESIIHVPSAATWVRVRLDSMKRVASAVGEGSIAIRLVHDYLRST